MVDVLTVLLGIMLFVLGVGLGATLTLKDFRRSLRKPKAIAVGWTSQFGVMPLLAFTMAKIFSLSDNLAIGLILTASAPGGTTSNLLTYWSRGDVALSITMSFASTLCAMGMLPLLIVVYIQTSFNSDSLEIPFSSIATSLVLIAVPSLGGVFVRYKSVKWALILEKVASVIGAIFLAAALVFGSVDNKDKMFDQAGEVYFIALFLQIIATALGYGLARLAKLTHRDARTIAMETGVQNVTLILALIVISYDDSKERDELLVMPLLYGFFYVINSSWITYVFRFHLAKWDENDPYATKPKAPRDLSRMNTQNLDTYDKKVKPQASKEDLDMIPDAANNSDTDFEDDIDLELERDLAALDKNDASTAGGDDDASSVVSQNSAAGINRGSESTNGTSSRQNPVKSSSTLDVAEPISD